MTTTLRATTDSLRTYPEILWRTDPPTAPVDARWPERLRGDAQNLRWWLRSPVWSMNMTLVSNHHAPSTRWNVSL